MRLTHAERLLQDMGVTEPCDIDLEAIAYDVGARVEFRPLDGCDARIVGNKDRAIITIKSNISPSRQRFSIAHELGHWHYDRGKCLACRLEEIRPRDAISPERIADGYAADLLMPDYLFKPIARKKAKLTFKTVAELSDIFATSLTATAIRLVETDHTPAVLVCHGPNGRKWFARAPSVPQKWFPQNDLDVESCAFGIQFGGNIDYPTQRKIGADAWFDRRDADHFEIQEQTVRTGPEETLTIISINDPKMLVD
jgi:IrrE N-terminal-like domain